MSPLTQFTAAGAASSHGLSSSAVNIAIGLLVLAWIIYAQRLVVLGRARARGLVPAVASSR